MSRFPRKTFLVAFVLVACKGVDNTGGTPKQGETVTGVWTGMEGPNLNRLIPTARLELTEDAGSVTGVLYSSNIFPDGGTWPVASFTGTRDGGFVFLREVPVPGFEGEDFVFTGTFTPPNRLEGVEVRAKMDGGPLPVYFKLDRTK